MTSLMARSFSSYMPSHTSLSLPLPLFLSTDGLESHEWLRGEGAPQREDPQQRLRWQAYLEFTHNHTVGDLTWDGISSCLPRSDRLRSLVLAGIPHTMRPQVCFGGRSKALGELKWGEGTMGLLLLLLLYWLSPMATILEVSLISKKFLVCWTW